MSIARLINIGPEVEGHGISVHQPETTGATAATLTEFHYFTELPPEIRKMILEYALCPGIVYVHAEDICSGDYNHTGRHVLSAYRDLDRTTHAMPGAAHDRDDNRRLRYTAWERVKSDTSPINQALLRGISKAMQSEASAVFYGPKNHFVLPCGPYDFPRTSGHSHIYEDDLPEIPPFYSVSYTFDMRDVHWDPWTVRNEVVEWDKEDLKDYAETHTPGEIRADMGERIHLGAKIMLDTVWDKRCDIMRKKLTAEFLQIDLEECFCPLGCCRLVEEVCENVGPFDNGFPSTFEVVGVKDEEEAAIVKSVIASVNFVLRHSVVCKDAKGNSLKDDLLSTTSESILGSFSLLAEED